MIDAWNCIGAPFEARLTLEEMGLIYELCRAIKRIKGAPFDDRPPVEPNEIDMPATGLPAGIQGQYSPWGEDDL